MLNDTLKTFPAKIIDKAISRLNNNDFLCPLKKNVPKAVLEDLLQKKIQGSPSLKDLVIGCEKEYLLALEQRAESPTLQDTNLLSGFATTAKKTSKKKAAGATGITLKEPVLPKNHLPNGTAIASYYYDVQMVEPESDCDSNISVLEDGPGRWYRGLIIDSHWTTQSKLIYTCVFDTPLKHTHELTYGYAIKHVRSFRDNKMSHGWTETTVFPEKPAIALLMNDRVSRWFNTREMAGNVANIDGVVGAFIEGYIMDTRVADNARSLKIWFDAPISAESWHTEKDTSLYRTTYGQRSLRVHETQRDDGDLCMDNDEDVLGMKIVGNLGMDTDDDDEDAFYAQGEVLCFETGDDCNHVYGILPSEVKVKGQLGTCLMQNGAYNTYSTTAVGQAIQRCKDPLFAKDCPNIELNCLLRHRIRKPQQVQFEINLIEAEYKIAHKTSNPKQLKPEEAAANDAVHDNDSGLKTDLSIVNVKDSSTGGNSNAGPNVADDKVDVDNTSTESIAKDADDKHKVAYDPIEAGVEKGVALGPASVAPSAGTTTNTTTTNSINEHGSLAKKGGGKRKSLSLRRKPVPPTALYTSDNAALQLRLFPCLICSLPADGAFQCETCYAHQHEMCAGVMGCPTCDKTNKHQIPPAPTSTPVLTCGGMAGFDATLGFEVGIGSSLWQTSSTKSLALSQSMLQIQQQPDTGGTDKCNIAGTVDGGSVTMKDTKDSRKAIKPRSNKQKKSRV